ncbi:MAG: tRNA (guanine(46)-N(7))-methyltransferase TrmB [Rhodospirillales bacterium]
MSSEGGGSRTREALRLHGRRRGRRLRAGRTELLTTLLPRLRIELPPADRACDPRTLFDRRVTAVWLEVGFGAGEHLAAQALAHPDIGFVGCEPYVNGVAATLARIRALDLANVRLFDDDARLLTTALTDAAVARVFVLFGDPWPKQRHRDRRFVGRATLCELARILEDDGEFWFASDRDDYVRWTLEHVTADPSFAWIADGPADWRHRPAGWCETRYETKALARGDTCTYLRFRRLPRRRSAKNPCLDGGDAYIGGELRLGSSATRSR